MVNIKIYFFSIIIIIILHNLMNIYNSLLQHLIQRVQRPPLETTQMKKEEKKFLYSILKILFVF